MQGNGKVTDGVARLLRAVTMACKQMLVSPLDHEQAEVYTTSRIGPRESQHSGCKHSWMAGPDGCLSVFSSLPVLLAAMGASARDNRGSGCRAASDSRPDDEGDRR